MKSLIKNGKLVLTLNLIAFVFAQLVFSGTLNMFSYWLGNKFGLEGKFVFVLLGVLIMLYGLFVCVVLFLHTLRWTNPFLYDKWLYDENDEE